MDYLCPSIIGQSSTKVFLKNTSFSHLPILKFFFIKNLYQKEKKEKSILTSLKDDYKKTLWRISTNKSPYYDSSKKFRGLTLAGVKTSLVDVIWISVIFIFLDMYLWLEINFGNKNHPYIQLLRLQKTLTCQFIYLPPNNPGPKKDNLTLQWLFVHLLRCH